MPQVEVRGLMKRFGRVAALTGVDLVADEGTVVGVLGPNGAGKTTLVRILATLLDPDAGWARIGGHDVVRGADRVRPLIGLTGQYASVDQGLTGRENLLLVARLLGTSRRGARHRAEELLERFDLLAVANRLASTYSGGLRRRLDLAVSLVGQPRVLFLDEPTTGLDPRSRAEVWTMVRALAAGGSTVLLTTQYLEEADHLANRIVVMNHGQVVAAGTPEELRNTTGGRVLEITPSDAVDLPRVAAVVGELTRDTPRTDPHARRVNASVPHASDLPRILGGLGAANIAISELAVRAPSLSEAFFSLTQPTPEPDLDQRGSC